MGLASCDWGSGLPNKSSRRSRNSGWRPLSLLGHLASQQLSSARVSCPIVELTALVKKSPAFIPEETVATSRSESHAARKSELNERCFEIRSIQAEIFPATRFRTSSLSFGTTLIIRSGVG